MYSEHPPRFSVRKPRRIAAETDNLERPVTIVVVTEDARTQGNHTRVQGYGVPSIPRSCSECGAALTLVYYADGGTLWTGCPNDPGLARS